MWLNWVKYTVKGLFDQEGVRSQMVPTGPAAPGNAPDRSFSLRPGAEAGLADAILATVSYADIFDFPLTRPEIHRYLSGIRVRGQVVEQALENLGGSLSRSGAFITLRGRETLVYERLRRQQHAARLWPAARAYGRIISRLPFVRMVAVTGALAVSNVLPGADIDYLLVTQPGRLWLCRAMVLAVGRAASRQGFQLCPNYLVSLHALRFPDHSLYAAHEVAQMVPLAGQEVYVEVRRQNDWVEAFLPNAGGPPPGTPASYHAIPERLSRPRLELIAGGFPFDRLERWERRRKIRKLSREQSGSPESHFTADTCKGHLHRHQERTQAALEERLASVPTGGRV